MADQDSQKNDDRGLARRDFFRRFLLKGLDKAEGAGRKVAGQFTDAMAVAGQASDGPVGSALPAPQPPPKPVRFLRPPGALPELELAQTCSRCGDCVQACPAQAIRIDATANVAGGLPFIVAREQPCVVCTALSCMSACPTGALKVLTVSEISMGLALVDHERCLRGPFDDATAGETGANAVDVHRGEDCRLCVTSCPVGEAALKIDASGRVEVGSGCIGCGVCERACPTAEASIFVSAE